jgi:hypothetical protein
MKKDTSKKSNKKVIILIILLVPFSLFVWLEINNISIDRYNFKEFEKAKIVLNNNPEEIKTPFTTKEIDLFYSKVSNMYYTIENFNKVYNTNIKPIKNCYAISRYNWEESYLFWFKLESFLYKLRYWNWYFVYPKYDKPYPTWLQITWQPDTERKIFYFIISNPCSKVNWENEKTLQIKF